MNGKTIANGTGAISDSLAEIINECLKESVFERKPYELRKKWLERFFAVEGADYLPFEASFLQLIQELSRDTLDRKSIRRLADSCFIRTETLDDILEHLEAKREQSIRSAFEAEKKKVEEEKLAEEVARQEKERKKAQAEERRKVAAQRREEKLKVQQEEDRKREEERNVEMKRLKEEWTPLPESCYIGHVESNSYIQFQVLDPEKKTTIISCRKQYDKTRPKELDIDSSFKYNGEMYSIVSVDENAFEGETSLEKISFPETVKNIGANAFYGCSNLREIRFDGQGVMVHCNSFDETSVRFTTLRYLENTGKIITIQNETPMLFPLYHGSPLYISPDYPYLEWQFMDGRPGCFVLRERKGQRIPNYLTIPTRATKENDDREYLVDVIEGFRACPSIKTLKIASSPGLVISREAFRDCKNLWSVTFESIDKLTIHDMAFSSCEKLSLLNVGEESSVKKFSTSAFQKCPLPLKKRIEIIPYQLNNLLG